MATVYSTTYPASNPAYHNFINMYGVWVSADLKTPLNEWVEIQYSVTLPAARQYSVIIGGDDRASIYINNNLIGSSTVSGVPVSFTVTLPAGTSSIRVQAINSSNFGAVAAAIISYDRDDPLGYIREYSGADDTVYWTTRDQVDVPPEPTGVTWIKRSDGWHPLKKLWLKTQTNTWSPVAKLWTKIEEDVWEQVYPTPAGILTIVPSSLTLSVYNNYDSNIVRVALSNTGDSPLVINNISIRQSTYYRTTIDYSGVGGSPQNILIGIGQSKYIDVRISGNNVTTSDLAQINFDYTSGPLGSVTATLPVTGTVRANYATLSVSPSAVSYQSTVDSAPPSKTITIRNTGNGGTLNISSITALNNTTISGFPTSLGMNESGTFTITAPSGLSAGSYYDTITIESNGGTVSVPVTYSVVSTGVNEYIVPGTYSWTVPTGVTNATLTAVGAGGGGGGSTEVGNGAGGGGGGSGAYAGQTINLTPGEVITFVIGAGGAGAPQLDRGAGASGSEGPGLPGGTTRISGLFGTISLAGGQGGSSAYASGQSGVAGGGGAGGSPNGNPGSPGEVGTNDYSSVSGGAGGVSGAPGTVAGAAGVPGNSNGKSGTRGSGGGGAGTSDRVSPYTWGGGKGGDGYVIISW